MDIRLDEQTVCWMAGRPAREREREGLAGPPGTTASARGPTQCGHGARAVVFGEREREQGGTAESDGRE